MAARVAVFTMLAIALVLGSLYVLPIALGYEIDCGTLERAICEEAWQQVAPPPRTARVT